MRCSLESLIEKQICAEIIEEKETEIYRYGYMILFEWGFSLITAGLIRILTGARQSTPIFLKYRLFLFEALPADTALQRL